MTFMVLFFAIFLIGFAPESYGDTGVKNDVDVDCRFVEKDSVYRCNIFDKRDGQAAQVGVFYSKYHGQITKENLNFPSKEIILYRFTPSDTFDPVGRFYYLVYDWELKRGLLSGYADDAIETMEIDPDPGKEVIVKTNVANFLPMNFIHQYVPSVAVFSLFDGAEVAEIDPLHYPIYMNKWRNELMDLKRYFESREQLLGEFAKENLLTPTQLSEIQKFITFQLNLIDYQYGYLQQLKGSE